MQGLRLRDSLQLSKFPSWWQLGAQGCPGEAGLYSWLASYKPSLGVGIGHCWTPHTGQDGPRVHMRCLACPARYILIIWEKIRSLKLSLLWEMLFADKEHFTTRLKMLLTLGTRGAPLAAPGGMLTTDSLVCETRDLPAKISPYIRRKSCFESAWGKGKGVQAVSWSRDMYFCLSSCPFSRSNALPDFNWIWQEGKYLNNKSVYLYGKLAAEGEKTQTPLRFGQLQVCSNRFGPIPAAEHGSWHVTANFSCEGSCKRNKRRIL